MKPRRSTPEGNHLPVLLDEVIRFLNPQEGEVAVDCTLGNGGHALALLSRLGPSGRLIACDLDGLQLPEVTQLLHAYQSQCEIHHGNFAGISSMIFATSMDGCDCLLADLGMSSMQVDDRERGFSFRRTGPLDMRMDRSRGNTAAELLQTISEEELTQAFRELGDEPQAEAIANAIVEQRQQQPLRTTTELSRLVQRAAPVPLNPLYSRNVAKPWQQKLRPVARVFQTLRILVNRELANLQALLRSLPHCLKSGGRCVIISFHSGEDRLVKAAFKQGLHQGLFRLISDVPVRAGIDERVRNPRSRSARLRWAVRS